MIRLQYFNGRNLLSLLNQVNDYCSKHSNVEDVQIFQRLCDGFNRIGVQDYCAVIKERIDNNE